jgi:hypothetical protein
MPDTALAGSDLIDALIKEMRAKGMNTVDGWTDKYTNVSVTGVRFGRLNIEYDPTLDLIGESKRLYIWDSNHLRLRPPMMFGIPNWQQFLFLHNTLKNATP